MKYRKYERERAEMLKIDEKTALLDDIDSLAKLLTNYQIINYGDVR